MVIQRLHYSSSSSFPIHITCMSQGSTSTHDGIAHEDLSSMPYRIIFMGMRTHCDW